MRDEISLRTRLQRQQSGYVQGFFFCNPAAIILLLASEPTAVPGSGSLSLLFTPWGCVSVVCFGFAAALVLAFFGFGGWLGSGSSSSCDG